MNFSELWKSTWPISTVFPAPNLLSGTSAKPMGPLLFGPTPSSPPLPLFSSPSLYPRIPLPLRSSSLRDGLRVFFSDPKEDFVPTSVQADLVTTVLPDSDDGSPDPVSASHLHVLRCRNETTFVLFFPTGENADEIGYLVLSLKGAEPEIMLDKDGDVFRQKEGFVHKHHRITGISVVPAESPDIYWELSGNLLTEGYLLATTLYSVNWFRVETRVFDSGSDQERPFLVPMGRRSFSNGVVRACWNPHFQEESVVLLENGDLYWIKLNSKRGVRIAAPEEDSGRWLGCEFGGQPWILIVASSMAVVTVDLRSKNGKRRTVLAKDEKPDSYMIVHSMENDHFIAFCRAGYDDFHFSVVTEHHLFLFDTRQPLIPVLKWDHGLDHPCYVAMFRLSELRPSEEFKWASESGFAILVGSFWNCEFSLFCYGPKAIGSSNNPSLYAWELPSDLCLSDRQCVSVDDLLREEFSKEELRRGVEWQQKKEIVVGFYILPEGLLTTQFKSEDPGAFALIRLMSSGKLELQRYSAFWNHFSKKSNCKGEVLSEIQESLLFSWAQEDRLSIRHDFSKFDFLTAYLTGKLSSALNSELRNPRANHTETKQHSLDHDVWDLIDKELCPASPKVSDVINDVSFPTSIHEIAARRVLSCLPSNLLHLAFSKYSKLFSDQKDSSFEFLEVPISLPHKCLPPFFTGKPSGKSEKWSHKALPGDSLVGPVLPLPILLTLQKIGMEERGLICPVEASDDDLLNCQCNMILEGVFPAISIAEIGNSNEWISSQELQDEKPFFIYKPQACFSGSSTFRKTSTAAQAEKDEHQQMDHDSSSDVIKDDKFSIFISGIYDKPNSITSGHEVVGLEMFDDLLPVRLDVDSSVISFSPDEHKIYKCLKRQFSKWQETLEPYQDFCTSSKIPKMAQ